MFVYGTGDPKKPEYLLSLNGAKERLSLVSTGIFQQILHEMRYEIVSLPKVETVNFILVFIIRFTISHL